MAIARSVPISATLTSADEPDKPWRSADAGPVFELGALVVLRERDRPLDLVETRTTSTMVKLLEKRDIAQAVTPPRRRP